MNAETFFMPAELSSPAEVARQRSLFSVESGVTAALDGVLDFVAVLNRRRQAVFLNKAARDFLRLHGIEDGAGLRMGGIFGCSHAGPDSAVCGTTEACRRCGSGCAQHDALQGRTAVNECRILSAATGEDLDLKVKVQPLKCGGEDFLLLVFEDISSEKRRQVLERLFFHDILNTAGGVQGLVALMSAAEPAEAHTYVPAAVNASNRMIDQILSQKDLAAAERGDLHPKPSEVDCAGLLEEIAGLFRGHDVARGKTVTVKAGCAGLVIRTDRTLLSRVIGNLLKNALEAERQGAVITLACERTTAGAAFTVHNPGAMPDDARLQVFQRSFSTKGEGRGLGTYSIRLFTEKYLGGKVSFSTGSGGTEFRAEYPASL